MESYEIFVRSPFGKYRGTISFSRDGGTIQGTISFLVFSSDFTGAADGDSLSFKGALETPIGKIDYDARARVSGSQLEKGTSPSLNRIVQIIKINAKVKSICDGFWLKHRLTLA